MMLHTALALILTLPATLASAEEVFRIEIGKDYRSYSDSDLRRRVWELERAVWQLQQRVFQLESGKNQQPVNSWLCTIEALGNTYTGVGGTKAVAASEAIKACKADRKGDGFFCKDPKCEQ